MPVIHIDYDPTELNDSDAEILSKAVHEVVSRVTGIEDVPVYAQAPKHSYKIAPIEVVVRFSSSKIDDLDKLTSEFKEGLSDWKSRASFGHPINLTVIPMDWKLEIGSI